MLANFSLRAVPVAAPAVALLLLLLLLHPVTMLPDDGLLPMPPSPPGEPTGHPGPGDSPPSVDAANAVPGVPQPSSAPLQGPFNGGPWNPGTVTVYDVEVTIAVTPLNNSSGMIGFEPIWVPHCALGRFLDDHARFELDPPVFKEGIVAVVIIHYSGPGSLSEGGDERVVMTLATGGRAPVAAAWNLSTILYWIDPASSSPIQPAKAARADQVLVGSYVTDFPNARFEIPAGPTLVEETHVVTGVYQVPLVTGPAHYCD